MMGIQAFPGVILYFDGLNDFREAYDGIMLMMRVMASQERKEND